MILCSLITATTFTFAPQREHFSTSILRHNTEFQQCDARNLEFTPDFDLIFMRHPEPSSAPKIWTEIFIEAALFAQKAQAPMIVIALIRHELQFFTDIIAMMGVRAPRLVKTYINEALRPCIDESGADFAHDRYVAFFTPTALPATIASVPRR
jgi:hypothetical protein